MIDIELLQAIRSSQSQLINSYWSRLKSAEAMRDHYKELSDSWMQVVLVKSRELKLMEKVADCWQDKLIKANERIKELEDKYEVPAL